MGRVRRLRLKGEIVFREVVSQAFAFGVLFVWACCADVLVALMCFPVDFGISISVVRAWEMAMA